MPRLHEPRGRVDGQLIHLNKRDVTFLCFSRAPIDRLAAYKKRMGWQFPYVSTYGTDFPFDFGLALTEEQAQQIPEDKEMIDNPPGWLQEWSEQVAAEVKDGLRENPSFIAFARENGTVYHTYTVMAPDPFVGPLLRYAARANAEAAAGGAAQLAQGLPIVSVGWFGVLQPPSLQPPSCSETRRVISSGTTYMIPPFSRAP
jgi:hypothetical protein